MASTWPTPWAPWSRSASGSWSLLIWLLLSAAPREAALARLAAMGLSARQGSWLVLAEALPEILVATAAGTACAWALVSLVGPDLSLAGVHRLRGPAWRSAPSPPRWPSRPRACWWWPR